MFVLFVGSTSEYRKGREQQENSEQSVCACMEGKAEERKEAGMHADRGLEADTHRSATRPVDWLMPSQVPSACTSRPESTLPLLLTSSWTAGTLSLEGAGVVNASNEWKCAGRVGRARYSSRFAHRMLSHPRSAGGPGGASVTHSAYSGWVRDQKPTHMLLSWDGMNRESVVMGMIGRVWSFLVQDFLRRTKSVAVGVPEMREKKKGVPSSLTGR